MSTQDKKIVWRGTSGKGYEYGIYKIGTVFKELPGNYIFAREVSSKRWRSVYIGQTNNLNKKIKEHELKDGNYIRPYGATHIHVHLEQTPISRQDEEKDLRDKWGQWLLQPPP